MTIQFQPINDQVLIKLDSRKRSQFAIAEKPEFMPSGHVVAVGRGTYVPGTGFVETQVKPGDHVALLMDGTWSRLPIEDDPSVVYVSVSESLILGKLTGADVDSAWFKHSEEAAASLTYRHR